ncbi:hypothetical protein [Nocardia sp. NPDC049707]|uniref:hypothetical protein n=1 Tax=Nocardia sp. NPDC049707 TaxID=3154735 RepID=UPI0034317330
MLGNEVLGQPVQASRRGPALLRPFVGGYRKMLCAYGFHEFTNGGIGQAADRSASVTMPIGCRSPSQIGKAPPSSIRGAAVGLVSRTVKLSGHTSVRSLAKYARVSDEGLRRYQADSDPAARRRPGR